MSEQTGSWQPDPFGRNQYRYWDGARWTDQVSNEGVVSTDPATGEVAQPTPAAQPIGSTSTEPTHPTEGVAPTAPAAAGSKLPLVIGAGLVALVVGVGAYFLFIKDDDKNTDRANVVNTTTPQGLPGIPGVPGGGFMGVDALPPGVMAMVTEQIVAETGLSRDQAECFVQNLMGEDGLQSLFTNPEALNIEDFEDSAAELYTSCGIDPEQMNSGGSGSSSSSQRSYGDDPILDGMWDACQGGDMSACDDLYFDSPRGSDYRTFADTCGGRQAEGTGNLCTIEFG